ncbi:MAG: TIGR03435 family protein [Elusimicrobiota bacterium]
MLKLALSFLLAVPAAAAPKKAPEFKIAKVFNAPVSEIKSLSSLKGKVVFLEFWATSCAPCVAGVPRTNRLIDALKGEPVVFIAVTDEPADMIATYLKTHEFKAWVGVDEARSSVKAFKNRSRPDGYLIGKDGTLLGRIYPDNLQESDIRDAIAGKFKAKAKAVHWQDDGPPATAAAETTFFEAVISSASGRSGMSMGESDLTATSVPFTLVLSLLWDIEQDQIIAENPPVKSLNVRLKTPPESFEQGRELLKQAILATFGVSVQSEIKETDVYLLSLSTGPGAPRPAKGDPAVKSGIMASGGGRLLGKTTMARFAKALWGASSKPVIDDTGLQGDYTLDLEWKWNRDDDSALGPALAAQGLRLVPGRRKVEFLRVVPVKRK